jgi:[acyl-carrier-protein] S-malonyltransferase
MSDANRQFADAIATTMINNPAFPVLSNSTVKPLTTADEIREELIGHMEGPVLWTQTVLAMKSAGISTLIEAGPGAVLAGLVKRIDREIAVKGIGDLGLDLPVDSAK